ncbi:MAG: bifunctional methionine sulfoxide reductase B/A protein [Bacteroidales bacterium]
MNYRNLTPDEEYVIVHKGTERPFTGEYTNNKEKGTYHCKRCDAPLYHSAAKFDSGCGWPSFDDEIEGAVKRVTDADGRRTEIICTACDAHLGHVFNGEGFTDKNTRHCVNSISMVFVKEDEKQLQSTETAIFAGGCFWGVEHHFLRKEGVISTSVGYIGGHRENPTYEEVCNGTTGHAEAMKIVFDPNVVSYRELAILFFEIHDFTQVNRQGPDIGEQYRSEIFYLDEKQKVIIGELMAVLTDKGYKVATRLTRASRFWDAEGYHQRYYERTGSKPYCHAYRKVF